MNVSKILDVLISGIKILGALGEVGGGVGGV